MKKIMMNNRTDSLGCRDQETGMNHWDRPSDGLLHKDTPITANHAGHGTFQDAIHLDALLRDLTGIRADVIAESALIETHLNDIHLNYQASARNLLHYLALRRHDLRPLQLRLAEMGLSSLGRSESHVLATLDTVLDVLDRLGRRPSQQPPKGAAVLDFSRGRRLPAQHAEALLGPAPLRRQSRIMVTMPGEAADDYKLVHDLLRQGMDCVRIDCAHDNAPVWLRIIDNVKRARQALGLPCKVVMDLAGPKLRTGPLGPGPAVVRIHPCRDIFGRVIAPARIWLTSATTPDSPPLPAATCLFVAATWLARLRPGGRVRLTDARQAKRVFTIVETTELGCWAEATKTTYVVPGTVLRYKSTATDRHDAETFVGQLPPSESRIFLKPGDQLILQRDLAPSRPARYDSAGRMLSPASIGCTIPSVFDDVRSGESIWFDDGKIGGVVEKVEPTRVFIRITHAPPAGERLRSNKGINLPDSNLQLTALTPGDLENLPFIAEHADVVGLSFANNAQDVELLQQHLPRLGSRQPAIVLKIETRRGFEHLPEMLLTAMRWPSCGVMIARGDLAVECGFERLAEIHEEIIRISEAAHVPVIWTTQVLEPLATWLRLPRRHGMACPSWQGFPGLGHRAECVMLDEGSHVLAAVRVLDDILRRMQEHKSKRRTPLRELRLTQSLLPESHVGSERHTDPNLTTA
jgi:pyruvate kinase